MHANLNKVNTTPTGATAGSPCPLVPFPARLGRRDIGDLIYTVVDREVQHLVVRVEARGHLAQLHVHRARAAVLRRKRGARQRGARLDARIGVPVTRALVQVRDPLLGLFLLLGDLLRPGRGVDVEDAARAEGRRRAVGRRARRVAHVLHGRVARRLAPFVGGALLDAQALVVGHLERSPLIERPRKRPFARRLSPEIGLHQVTRALLRLAHQLAHPVLTYVLAVGAHPGASVGSARRARSRAWALCIVARDRTCLALLPFIARLREADRSERAAVAAHDLSRRNEALRLPHCRIRFPAAIIRTPLLALHGGTRHKRSATPGRAVRERLQVERVGSRTRGIRATACAGARELLSALPHPHVDVAGVDVVIVQIAVRYRCGVVAKLARIRCCIQAGHIARLHGAALECP
eukprot:scaffold30826_cov67-Phaeocystis_antarctica.AAC.4